MSKSNHDVHPPALHGHDEHHDDGQPHFSVRGYLIGFLLSVALTAIPFWLVMAKIIPGSTGTSIAILTFAAVQIVVHMVFFLHLDPKSEGGWNVLALIFTMVLVVIALTGTVWVMHHLNDNMMPMASDAMHAMP